MSVRRKSWSRAAAIVTVPLLLFLGAAQAAASEGPFWKVIGPNGSAYLLGSIHFGVNNMYPLSPAIDQAFESADRLVVEIDLSRVDPATMAQWFTARGLYTDGSTLADHLSPDVWATLKQQAQQFGAPLELIAVQRPWFAALTLANFALERKGFQQQLGVDVHFLTRARGRMPVVELEGFEYQLELLSGFSGADQEHFLAGTLNDLDAGSRLFENIIAAWREGDAAALDAEINQAWRADAKSRRLYEQLIDRRNVEMTAKVTDLLESGGTSFVVVGAAHMVGEGGLARRLEAAGYRVEKR